MICQWALTGQYVVIQILSLQNIIPQTQLHPLLQKLGVTRCINAGFYIVYQKFTVVPEIRAYILCGAVYENYVNMKQVPSKNFNLAFLVWFEFLFLWPKALL